MGTVNMRRSTSLNLGGSSYQSSHSVTVPDGKRQVLPITIPDGSTDFNVDLAFTLASLKGYRIHSDQALTLETNDGTTPDDTIPMAAGQQRNWLLGDDEDPVFTDDVTSLKVTNASGEDAELSIEVVTDGTP